MNGKTEQDRCRLIAHQVVTEFARDKVSKALYEAVLESLDFGPRDLPSPADRDWMRGAMATPLRDATDAALEVLSWSVGRTLEQAPAGLMDRFERSHSIEQLAVD